MKYINVLSRSVLNSELSAKNGNDPVLISFGNVHEFNKCDFELEHDVIYNPYIITQFDAYSDLRILPDASLFRSHPRTGAQLPNCAFISTVQTALKLSFKSYKSLVQTSEDMTFKNVNIIVRKDYFNLSISGLLIEPLLFSHGIRSYRHTTLLNKFISNFRELSVYNLYNKCAGAEITISHGKIDRHCDIGHINSDIRCIDGANLPVSDSLDQHLSPTIFYNRNMSVAFNNDTNNIGYIATSTHERFDSWNFGYDTPSSIVSAIIAIRCGAHSVGLFCNDNNVKEIYKYINVLRKYAKSKKTCLNFTQCSSLD